MSFLMRFYLNTALASFVLFLLLAIWGSYNALQKRALTPNYRAALMISELPLAALSVFYAGLRIIGHMASHTLLPLIYSLVALAVLPCVHLYVQEQSPRRKSWSVALACLFVCAMVIRVIQTGVAF